MAQSPGRAITGAAHGACALIKGHYRLIDRPAEREVTVENILAPHRRRTLRRMRSQQVVLCVQDTTVLNFTRRPRTQGLGPIGSNQAGASAHGLHLHTTLALDPDGVPLGVLRAASYAPDDTPGPKPRERRKSFRWIEGLRDLAAAAEDLPDTRPVCVLGREVPELPPETQFSDTELRVLEAFARQQDRPAPRTRGDAVRTLARLGGWTGNPHAPPGAQLLWHGSNQLTPMAFAFELKEQYG